MVKQKAFELLSDRSKWCQWQMAVDASGRWALAGSDKAVAFCALGAIVTCYPKNQQPDVIRRAIEVSERIFREDSLATLNDELGYEAVMQVLREANV